MGRTAKAARPAIDDAIIDTKALNKAAASLPVLAAQAAAAMEIIGYDLAYDRERVVQEARFYMAHSAEAMLEAGKRLIVLKEHEPHGEFEQIVQERLGLGLRSAQAMMQASVKYLGTKALPKAQPVALLALGKSKLFDLMSESDDELASLAKGGTLAGLTLDEIDRMTRRELQAALRETRAEKEAVEQVSADKSKRIDQLKAAQKRIDKLPPDEVLAQLQKEATEILSGVLGGVRGQLRQALIALKNHGDDDHSQFMAGLVGQVQADLIALRDEFSLADTVGDGTPAWQKFVPGSNPETQGPLTHGRRVS